MKIAFYAPLKSPRHARPSGDRRIARLFIRALEMAGYEVELASELRAWEGAGDARRQAEIRAQGLAEAAELIARYRRLSPAERPQIWFTYHLYHKAPDWLGAAVCADLRLPYVLAEASVAGKRAGGDWCEGYAQSLAAVRRAAVIFTLNSNDVAGLESVAGRAGKIVQMRPFAELPLPADTIPLPSSPSPADTIPLPSPSPSPSSSPSSPQPSDTEPLPVPPQPSPADAKPVTDSLHKPSAKHANPDAKSATKSAAKMSLADTKPTPQESPLPSLADAKPVTDSLHNPSAKPPAKHANPATESPPLSPTQKHSLRRQLAAHFRLDADCYWLACVAMMRADAKLASYQILADAAAKLSRRDWQLLVVGDGVAAARVNVAFAACPPGSVHLLGRLDADSITPLLRAADLFVWPAVGEAFGMAVLEAMGCGLPVLAGRSGGIADIVSDGVTGRLVTEPSGENMAAAMEEMLAEPATLARMSAASVTAFNRHHRLQQAAETIAKALADLRT